MKKRKTKMDKFIREIESRILHGKSVKEIEEWEQGIEFYASLYKNDVRRLAIGFQALQELLHDKIELQKKLRSLLLLG